MRVIGRSDKETQQGFFRGNRACLDSLIIYVLSPAGRLAVLSCCLLPLIVMSTSSRLELVETFHLGALRQDVSLFQHTSGIRIALCQIPGPLCQADIVIPTECHNNGVCERKRERGAGVCVRVDCTLLKASNTHSHAHVHTRTCTTCTHTHTRHRISRIHEVSPV